MLLVTGEIFDTMNILSVSTVLALLFFIGYMFEFAVLAIACHDRFKAINKKILSRRFLTRYDVAEFVEHHKKLLRIIEKIDEHLSPALIPIYFCLLFTATFMAYTEVRLILKTILLKTYLIINNFVWTFIYFNLMMVPCYAAEALRTEERKFKEICCDFLVANKFSDHDARRSLKIFVNLIDNSKAQLRTIFFNIDWNLLFQVIFIQEIISWIF